MKPNQRYVLIKFERSNDIVQSNEIVKKFPCQLGNKTLPKMSPEGIIFFQSCMIIKLKAILKK